MECIEVTEKKKVPRHCCTCLYGKTLGCGHADRTKDWVYYYLRGGCPSFWLDQHRFLDAERRW